MSPRVFLVTGTSTGFGAELVRVILQQGDIAVATAREPAQLSFSGTTSDNYLALRLDVTNKQDIEDAFKATIKTFGRVDVVVNNAGYGLGGVAESLSDEEKRRQFDVNFFAVVDITVKAISVMRELGTGGVIQQVSSIAGLVGFAGFAIYGATKFAVEGFTLCVAKEVDPAWNIHFQIAEPGMFRTDWTGRSLAMTDDHPAYANHFSAEKWIQDVHGTQQGDPSKAALAMYKLATMENPPLQCVIGPDAYQTMLGDLEARKEAVLKFEDLSTNTNFA